MKLAIVEQHEMGLNQEAIEEWAAYREEDLKKPLTPRARKMVEKKLLGYSESEQIRLVEAAIENNWRGIHYVDPPRVKSSRQSDIYEELTDTSWARG